MKQLCLAGYGAKGMLISVTCYQRSKGQKKKRTKGQRDKVKRGQGTNKTKGKKNKGTKGKRGKRAKSLNIIVKYCVASGFCIGIELKH